MAHSNGKVKGEVETEGQVPGPVHAEGDVKTNGESHVEGTVETTGSVPGPVKFEGKVAIEPRGSKLLHFVDQHPRVGWYVAIVLTLNVILNVSDLILG